MKGKKHNAEQIIKKLREADAMIATGKTIGHPRSGLGANAPIPPVFGPRSSSKMRL